MIVCRDECFSIHFVCLLLNKFASQQTALIFSSLSSPTASCLTRFAGYILSVKIPVIKSRCFSLFRNHFCVWLCVCVVFGGSATHRTRSCTSLSVLEVNLKNPFKSHGRCFGREKKEENGIVWAQVWPLTPALLTLMPNVRSFTRPFCLNALTIGFPRLLGLRVFHCFFLFTHLLSLGFVLYPSHHFNTWLALPSSPLPLFWSCPELQFLIHLRVSSLFSPVFFSVFLHLKTHTHSHPSIHVYKYILF